MTVDLLPLLLFPFCSPGLRPLNHRLQRKGGPLLVCPFGMLSPTATTLPQQQDVWSLTFFI